MNILIRNLCVISIISGIIISAMPEGAVKQTSITFSICVCTLLIVSAFKDFNFELYASQLSKYKEFEYKLSDTSGDAVNRLNRSVIEEECSSYIVHEANLIEVPIKKAEVKAEWDVSGYWVPYSAVIYGEYSKAVFDIIVCDFGIPGERITWME